MFPLISIIAPMIGVAIGAVAGATAKPTTRKKSGSGGGMIPTPGTPTPNTNTQLSIGTQPLPSPGPNQVVKHVSKFQIAKYIDSTSGIPGQNNFIFFDPSEYPNVLTEGYFMKYPTKVEIFNSPFAGTYIPENGRGLKSWKVKNTGNVQLVTGMYLKTSPIASLDNGQPAPFTIDALAYNPTNPAGSPNTYAIITYTLPPNQGTQTTPSAPTAQPNPAEIATLENAINTMIANTPDEFKYKYPRVKNPTTSDAYQDAKRYILYKSMQQTGIYSGYDIGQFTFSGLGDRMLTSFETWQSWAGVRENIPAKEMNSGFFDSIAPLLIKLGIGA